MKNTPLLSVGMKDAIKGLLVAMLTVLVSMVGSTIQNGIFPETWNEWKVILLASLGAGISYVIKNWLTNSNDQFLKKETNKTE